MDEIKAQLAVAESALAEIANESKKGPQHRAAIALLNALKGIAAQLEAKSATA